MKKRFIIFILILFTVACQQAEEHAAPDLHKPLSPRFNHVYLNVSNMEKSVMFYTSAFGLEVSKQIKKIKRTTADGKSVELVIHLSLLKFPGQDFVLEIGENPDFQAENSTANFTHIGIDVLDIESVSERVIKAGGVVTRPLSLVETEDLKVKNIFFTGPNGETIELMEVISGDF